MYSLAKISKILGLNDSPYLPISECVIDSRKVTNGSLFFALKGERTDGHLHLHEVANKGAFAAVVSKGYDGDDFGLTLLRVDDVKAALHKLAKEVLRERKTRVIGVTGSTGKTSTRECIKALLAKKFKVHSPCENYNSQATLPLVVLGAKGDEDFLILEMSMSEKGHIKKLADIAPPQIVVLTEIGMAHVANFDSIHGVAAAKAEIFTNEAEFAVIHEKSAMFDEVIEACTAESVIYPDEHGLTSPFEEKHLSENFSAAVIVAEYLGLTKEEIRQASLMIKPFKSRFERKKICDIEVIDDTYNASPSSVFAALENMGNPPLEGGKRIVAFGSMKELGKYSNEIHEKVAKMALGQVDALFCIGEECHPMGPVFKNAGKKFELFSSYEALLEAVKKEVKKGDLLLVKGARFHNLTRLVDYFEGVI